MTITNSIADFEPEDSVYFIADIAANHDGSLKKAKKLIRLAARAGANAAKFQHFSAETIVSKKGFEEVGKLSHQSSWRKTIFETYKDVSLPLEWTEELKSECQNHGIEFFTAPYSLEFTEALAEHIPAFKIGSGDITWIESIEAMCKYGKPIILATGASSLEDVDRAVEVIQSFGNKLILMQCNTNYTAEANNNRYLNLNVLNTYKQRYANIILGLSDHTTTEYSVLTAVALGARVIEKHFTDSNRKSGPDHKFSLDPKSWERMVVLARKVEQSLGDGVKRIEDNETESVLIQRRGLRYKHDLPENHIVSKNDLIALRPCLPDTLKPYETDKIVGRRLVRSVTKDDSCKLSDFDD